MSSRRAWTRAAGSVGPLLCLVVSACEKGATTLDPQLFGHLSDGRPSYLYTLQNTNGIRVRIIDYGAIIVSLETPDRDGRLADVVLGFDSVEPYEKISPSFGAVVGRVANRIDNGKLELDGRVHQLSINNPPHHLHGGANGFRKKLWSRDDDHEPDDASLRLTLTSPDGDEGYPGTLKVSVTYTLTDADELIVDYRATTDKTTVVNLTQHSYFNLAGHAAGSVEGHLLRIDADRFTPVSAKLIPTGEILPVESTPLDFTSFKKVGADIDSPFEQITRAQGYDHNWVLSLSRVPNVRPVAEAREPASGRTLIVSTDQPGLQLYTGNHLRGDIQGKGGVTYQRRAGFCLETQHFPDSPNHENFPSIALAPGEVYRTRTIFTFGTFSGQ